MHIRSLQFRSCRGHTASRHLLGPSSNATPPSCNAAHVNSAHRTPLVDAIVQRGRLTQEVPFHVPGHKRGCSAPPQLSDILAHPLRHDLTELPGLDYLASPDGPILEAQRLAAAAFGADQTWFLVNGTTVGLHAAVMATCCLPTDALIVARNAHASAFNAMVMAGCTPVWVQPRYAHGMAHEVTPAALQQGFEAARAGGLTPRAALVVSPTYFGILSDMQGLAAVCHANGAALIVDAAHGAHYRLISHTLPNGPSYCPLAAGADVVVQSTHKQLSALTQAAMLHLQGSRVDPARLSRALQILQTSSPSYLLMASLDAARAQFEAPGAADEPQAAAELLARYFSSAGPTQPCLLAASTESSTLSSPPVRDPWRFTVLVDHLGLTGWQAAEVLEQEHGIVVELANHAAIVIALGMGSTVEHVERLCAALPHLASSTVPLPLQMRPSSEEGPVAKLPGMRLTPRAAFFAASQPVKLRDAVGRVAAELLCPYPPGVPAVFPGEVVDSGMVAALEAVVEAGGKVVGGSGVGVTTIQVVNTSS